MKIFKKTLAAALTVLMLIGTIPFSSFAASPKESLDSNAPEVVDIQVFDVEATKENEELPEFSYKLTYSDGTTEIKNSTEKDENLDVEVCNGNAINVAYSGVSTSAAMKLLAASYTDDEIRKYFYYFTTDTGVEIWDFKNDLSGKVVIPSKINGLPVVSISGMNPNITSITIPATVKEIDIYSFTNEWSAKKLKEIKVSSKNTKYSSYDGVLYNKSKTKLLSIPYAKKGTITLPSTVKDISILSDIGDVGFTVKPSSNSKYFSYSNGVIYNKNKTKVVYANKSLKGSYTMPSTVKAIGECAFYNCDKLTSVKISNSVTTITYNVFESCNSLKSVTFPKNLKKIDGESFWGCNSLKSVKLPSKLKIIGSRSFAGTGIKSLTIPDSVTEIGSGAFSSCSSLSKVKLGKSVKKIGSYAFYGTSIKKITLPDSVKEVGDRTFSAEKLEKISIGSGLKSISTDDFGANGKVKITVSSKNKYIYEKDNAIYCKTNSSLVWYNNKKDNTNGLVIPNGTEWINYGAFNSWPDLKTVIVPNTVTYISYLLFSGMKSLTTFTFPKKSTIVEFALFNGCKKLVSVTIPKSVTFIYFDTFPKNLKHIYYEGSKSDWNKICDAEDAKYIKNAKIHYNSKGCKHKYSKGADLTCNECGYFEILPTTRVLNGKKYYYNDGKKMTSFSGVAKVDGKQIFVKNGVVKSNLDSPKVKLTNTKTGVKVSWNKVAGAKTYVVYRSVYSGGKWSAYKKYKTTKDLKFNDKVKSGLKVRYTVYAKNGKFSSKFKTGVAIKH